MRPSIGRKWRIASYLLVATMVIPLEAMVVPSALDLRPTCKRADEWIRNHQSSLPSSYDDFVSFPLSWRRRIYSRLNASEKATLWREHLRRASSSGSALTPVQRETINELIPLLQAEKFGPGKPHIVSSEQLLAVFPDRDQRLELFVNLGGSHSRVSFGPGGRATLEEASRHWVAAHPGLHPWIVGRPAVVQAFAGDCVCRVESESMFSCPHAVPICTKPSDTDGNYDCNETEDGCGIFGNDPCDGLCCRAGGAVCA
jgi:hypothetical protein